MADDDRALSIAERIADGSAIDWPDADAKATGPVDAEADTLEELKAIAALATLARTPIEWGAGRGADPSARWGPLTLIAPIGEGAFGRVYRAWDARLHRQVALKILHSSPAPGISAARAIDEARRLARIRHANVLTIHGADTFEGQTGIWTEFIEGRTLDAVVSASGPLAPDEVVRIGTDLCRALAAVHDAGLLHRDVKAANVMRETGGRIVLMDFGTGRDRDQAQTTVGDLSGTPLYLAPEIYAGASATTASDIYATGVLLYFLLTGRYPVAGQTLEDVRRGHQQRVSQDLRGVRADVPPALATVIEKALAADPAARFGSAGGFADALADALKFPMPIQVGRWPMGQWPTWRSRPIVRIAAGAAITVAVLAGWQVWRGAQTTRDAAAPVPGPLVSTTAQPDNWHVRLPQWRMGRMARNGRYIPYVDQEGRLQRFDALSTTSSVVVPGNPAASVLASLASPTGDRLAYTVQSADGGLALRMIWADGTRPHDLIPGSNTAFTPIPIEWSQDGKEILCRLRQANGTWDLALIGVDEGRVLPLVSGLQQPPHNASVSPDGRFVVYDRTPDGVPQGDLYIVGRAGSARALIGGPTHDLFPIWIPDGTGVIFARAVGTSPSEFDAWVLPVQEGAAHGEPRMVAEKIGPVTGQSGAGHFMMALTDDGAFYRATYEVWHDVYVTETDPRGAPIGAPRRIAPSSIGQHVSPAWSNDGRSVAYLTTRDEPNGGGVPLRTLTIQDRWPGTERTVNLDPLWVGGYAPAWSPDGQSVIIWGSESTDGWGLFSVDVTTSQVSLVVGLPQNTMVFCERNGDSLYYLDRGRGIIRRDLKTSTETVVVQDAASRPLKKFRVSPDGGRIAFVRGVVSQKKQELIVLELQGAERLLLEASAGDWLGVQVWSADGRWILYTRSDNADGGSTRDTLFRISADGGRPEDLGFAIAGNRTVPMMLQPTGSRLAYVERDGWLELRVVERLLPKAR